MRNLIRSMDAGLEVRRINIDAYTHTRIDAYTRYAD